MKIWSLEEEAERLAKRFRGVNRAAFARDYEVSGGQSMIYQHITGRRPIGLEAAQAYARGFNCSLADISPRLAEEARKAALSLGEIEVESEGAALTEEQRRVLSLMAGIRQEARDAWITIGAYLSGQLHERRKGNVSPSESRRFGEPNYNHKESVTRGNLLNNETTEKGRKEQ